MRREMQIMKLLEHPNVVKLYEVIDTRDYFYLVMEYVDGRTLAEKLPDIFKLKKKKREEVVRRIFTQLVDALAYCHRMHVVHRDVKPDNILVQPDGNIKVPCFMPHILEHTPTSAITTPAHVGTPKYTRSTRLAHAGTPTHTRNTPLAHAGTPTHIRNTPLAHAAHPRTHETHPLPMRAHPSTHEAHALRMPAHPPTHETHALCMRAHPPTHTPNSTRARRLLQLADWGFSNRADSALNTHCGTPYYASPELFRPGPYSGPPSDLWACGVLLFFLCFGKLPFKEVRAPRTCAFSGHLFVLCHP